MTVFTAISHDAFVADVRTLAVALERGGWTPDYLIGVGRGGLVPGAYLSHATGIALLSVDHSTRIAGFGDALLAQLAAKSSQGKRLLVIDDINDTGNTIRYLRGVLDGAGGFCMNVRFAVLINNIRSTASVDYWARSIDRSVDKDWFIFPWEAMATRTAHEAEAAEKPERLA